MRTLLTVFAIVAVTASAFGSSEAGTFDRRSESWLAYRSKWCLRGLPDLNDCGFATLEQCLASRNGVGGSCNPNQFYVEPPQYPRKSKRAQ